MCLRFVPKSSNGSSSAGNELNQEHNHCHYEQKVNQTAGEMESPAQEPKNQQNRKNCPKHVLLRRGELQPILILDAAFSGQVD
jgi:hypothetical protein